MRGRSPSHGKEISCLKTTSSCTLLGGVLCSGIDKFPTLFFFSFLNLSQRNILFPLLLFRFVFYSPINRGEGMAPLVPPVFLSLI